MPRLVVGAARPDFLTRLWQAVRAHPFAVALVLIALPAAGVAFALTRPADYEASTTLLLGDQTAQVQGQNRAGGVDARDVATARVLLASRTVAARAAQSLPGTSLSTLTDAIDVESKGDANALEVRATADSANTALRRAEAYARAYAPTASAIQPASVRPPPATLLAQAPADKNAGAPVVVYGVIGLALALLLVLLGAPLVRGLDRRVKDVADLEQIYGLPALAHIPRSRMLAKRGRSAKGDAARTTVGFSEEAEAFRTLRTNLRYFNVDAPVRSILVASPLPGDGKSTVARHLAITMASMGDSICLVNADLRKQEPSSLPTPDGLSLVLAGFDPDTALTEVPIAYDPLTQESRVLVELPSGPLPPNPAELLESDRMEWLIRQLERRFDLVIVDSPALVTVSDALSIVPRVSGVLAVGGIGQTTRQAAVDLRKQIELLGGRSLGVVANFSNQGRRYYGYYDKGQAEEARASQVSG